MTKPQFGALTPDVLCTRALAFVLARGFMAAESTKGSAENLTLASARLKPAVRIETLTAPLALQARTGIYIAQLQAQLESLKLRVRLARNPRAWLQRIERA